MMRDAAAAVSSDAGVSAHDTHDVQAGVGPAVNFEALFDSLRAPSQDRLDSPPVAEIQVKNLSARFENPFDPLILGNSDSIAANNGHSNAVLISALNFEGEKIGEIGIEALDDIGAQQVLEAVARAGGDATESVEAIALAGKHPAGPLDALSALEGNGVEPDKFDGNFVRKETLAKILKVAEDQGGVIRSPLGDDVGTIVERYGSKVSATAPNVRSLSVSEQNGIPAIDRAGKSRQEIYEANLAHACAKTRDGELRWVDIESANPEVMERLRQRFDLKPKAIEDCLHFDVYAKGRRLASDNFAVINWFDGVHTPEGGVPSVKGMEIHAFVREGLLITVHSGKVPVIDELMEAYKKNAEKFKGWCSLHLFSHIALEIMEENHDVIDNVTRRVGVLDDELLTGERGLSDSSSSKTLPALMRVVNALKSAIEGEQNMLKALAVRGKKSEAVAANKEVEELGDSLKSAVNRIRGMGEELTQIDKADDRAVNRRSGRDMRIVQFLLCLPVPTTIFGAAFGSNFLGIPYSSNALMWGSIALTALGTAGCMLWLSRLGRRR